MRASKIRANRARITVCSVGYEFTRESVRGVYFGRYSTTLLPQNGVDQFNSGEKKGKRKEGGVKKEKQRR
jgi:hypothetical protein